MFEDDPTVAEQIQESKKNLDQAESEAEAKRKQESLEWVVVTGAETAGVVGVEDGELQPEIMKAHTSRITTGINSFFIVLLLFFLKG